MWRHSRFAVVMSSGSKSSSKSSGRKPCDAKSHFVKTDKAANKTQWFYQCTHCVVAHHADEENVPEPALVRGQKDTLESHLDKCEYYQATVMADDHQQVAVNPTFPTTASASKSSMNNNKRPRLTHRQQKMDMYCPPPIKDDLKVQFHNLLLEFMAETNLPESFVARHSFKRLVSFCNPQCAKVLPTRQLLGGRILDNYAEAADTTSQDALKRQQTKQSGKRVNFLSDGWENISKDHILGVILSLAGTCITFGTFACGSRHDGLAIAEQLENVLLAMIACGWNVGAIITDNAGNCARGRRILALRWPKLIFLFCYAHQINLLVKDVVASSWQESVAKTHEAVKTLIKSSAKWLPRLRDVMMEMYGLTLGIIQMAATRWNSVQGMLASLLRMKMAFRMFYLKWNLADDFPDSLQVLGDDLFWKKVRQCRVIIGTRS